MSLFPVNGKIARIRLVAFVGCQTALNQTNTANLVDLAVDYEGVDSSLGFMDYIKTGGFGGENSDFWGRVASWISKSAGRLPESSPPG
jgi:hypothetical protein